MNELSNQRKIASLQSEGGSAAHIHIAMRNAVQKYASPEDKRLLNLGSRNKELIAELTSLRIELDGADFTEHVEAQDITNMSFNENFSKYYLNFDLVICDKVMSQIENPRHFFREVYKILKPGGKFLLSTHNTESITSILSFIFRGYHSAFGPEDYPTHISPLTEWELKCMAKECGFYFQETHYIPMGRIPKSRVYWQTIFPLFNGKRFCDNYLVVFEKRRS